MDTSALTKQCPRCGTVIEPERCADKLDKITGGITGGTLAGFSLFLWGPIGAVVLGTAGYFLGTIYMLTR